MQAEQQVMCLHKMQQVFIIHPQGDVMKISKANNAVTRIGYGGVAGNDHWQANWSPQNNGAGAVVPAVTEGGSSGSPLFDQAHRIVGQLHGGPSVCGGAQLWDYYGSFDVSWTGGGTNATRLSNWLDPNNTGAITTNTTNIAALADLNPTLSITGGVNILCNGTSTYTFSGLPANTVVNWTVSNTSLATIPSPSTGATVVLTKVGDGVVVLTATVTSFAGCFIKSVAQNIAVGTPGTSGISYSLTGPTTICINNPQGFNITASNSPVTLQYTWSVSAGSSIVSGGTGFNFAYVQRNTAPNGTVLVFASNACGQYAPPVGVRSYNGIGCTSGSSITISPNPAASEIINIEYHDVTAKNIYAKKEPISKPVTIKIVDANGNIRLQKKQMMQQNNIKLHTGTLENGIYILSVFDGKEWLSNRLIIGK